MLEYLVIGLVLTYIFMVLVCVFYSYTASNNKSRAITPGSGVRLAHYSPRSRCRNGFNPNDSTVINIDNNSALRSGNYSRQNYSGNHGSNPHIHHKYYSSYDHNSYPTYDSGCSGDAGDSGGNECTPTNDSGCSGEAGNSGGNDCSGGGDSGGDCFSGCSGDAGNSGGNDCSGGGDSGGDCF